MRLELARLHVYAALVLVLGLVGGGCDAGSLDDSALLDEDIAHTQEALTYYPDTAPDPLPSPADLIQPNGIATIYPGARACYPALPANNSAGIGGQFAGQVNKLPKLLVFWARDYYSPVSKIYAGPITTDVYGYYEKVLNRSNGFAAYFPGVFQFCIRNPAANTTPIQTNATVVTY
jgi:hypothetical protein